MSNPVVPGTRNARAVKSVLADNGVESKLEEYRFGLRITARGCTWEMEPVGTNPDGPYDLVRKDNGETTTHDTATDVGQAIVRCTSKGL